MGARTKLGRGYDPGHVTAIEYRRDALPAPKSLAENLLFMAGLLGTLYTRPKRLPPRYRATSLP
ncbi:hypothetical protein [Streptomyces uncialis]|uniref:hypothetical protein n=1 Tax=Streptomyces uncialis TaxID=1048205 RepID=UPI002251B844|nr:hypothetical protein [Streptomyces uncialis]